jgi:hypothetical protein
VKVDDITLTIIESRHPRELFKYLEGAKHEIRRTGEGIYAIDGLLFPVQLLVSGELSAESDLLLKELRTGHDMKSLAFVADDITKKDLVEECSAYLDILARANPEAFMEVINMKYPTMKELLEKSGVTKEWEARGREQAAAQYQAQNARYQAQNAQYQAQIAELQRQLAEARANR